MDKIELSQLEYNLSLTVEERLINHQRALDIYFEMKKVHEELYGQKPQQPTETAAGRQD